MQGYVQDALQKESLIAPLVEHFKTAALGKSYWEILWIRRKIDLNIALLSKFC